jgi:hypothetical protein
VPLDVRHFDHLCRSDPSLGNIAPLPVITTAAADTRQKIARLPSRAQINLKKHSHEASQRINSPKITKNTRYLQFYPYRHHGIKEFCKCLPWYCLSTVQPGTAMTVKKMELPGYGPAVLASER